MSKKKTVKVRKHRRHPPGARKATPATPKAITVKVRKRKGLPIPKQGNLF